VTREGEEMADLTGKVVWITGASSGIGEALAKVCGAAGAKLILSGRRVDALEAVANQIEVESIVVPFEVTDYDVLASKVEAAWGWQGRVDILINNAGISQRGLAIHTDPTVYQKIIDVDLLAPIWLTQLQLPKMVEAGGAHIVAISSVAGRIGAPLRTAYSAAKHGLIGYMDALRTEVASRHNIQVTNVLPGSVATEVSRNALTSDGSQRGKSDANIDGGDDPMDCAEKIMQAVANNVPEFIYAKGGELDMAVMRQAEPEKLFAVMDQIGAQVAERYENDQDD
jgi:short-subunit dehydrogenase